MRLEKPQAWGGFIDPLFLYLGLLPHHLYHSHPKEDRAVQGIWPEDARLSSLFTSMRVNEKSCKNLSPQGLAALPEACRRTEPCWFPTSSRSPCSSNKHMLGGNDCSENSHILQVGKYIYYLLLIAERHKAIPRFWKHQGSFSINPWRAFRDGACKHVRWFTFLKGQSVVLEFSGFLSLRNAVGLTRG